MNRFWTLACVLATLSLAAAAAAGGAAAKPHGRAGMRSSKPGARLDPGFGTDGAAKIATSSNRTVRIALGRHGRVYLLQERLLLAFEHDGRPARNFGRDGRVRIKSAGTNSRPEDLAVDSRGRVLVVGSTITSPQLHEEPSQPIPSSEPWIGGSADLNEAFVIRYLEDGKRDTAFGDGGEVDTTFGLPRPGGAPGKNVEYASPIVTASTITVDSGNRPIVGGSYATEVYWCGGAGEVTAPFTARLTTSGALESGYAGGRGFAIVEGIGGVNALATKPGGGIVTLSSGFGCGARAEPQPSTFEALTENGEPIAGLDPTRPSFLMDPEVAIDGKGRAIVIQYAPFYEVGQPRLVRLLSSGAVDVMFGFGGGTPLLDGFGAGQVAVDGRGGILVAAGNRTPEIVRYTSAGRRDGKFGKGGLLKGRSSGNRGGAVTALAVDGRGRIYAAGWVRSAALQTHLGVQLVRFLPEG